jgi:hypothetical protein
VADGSGLGLLTLPISVTPGDFTYINSTAFDEWASDDAFSRAASKLLRVMIGSGVLTGCNM